MTSTVSGPQIKSKAVALRLLGLPEAEINMGSAGGKWLWTPNGRRRIHERLVQQLEDEGLIRRIDNDTSRVGMTWGLVQ